MRYREKIKIKDCYKIIKTEITNINSLLTVIYEKVKNL